MMWCFSLILFFKGSLYDIFKFENKFLFFICNGNVSHMDNVADMELLFSALEEKPSKS